MPCIAARLPLNLPVSVISCMEETLANLGWLETSDKRTIHISAALSIGRSQNNAIRISSPGVSRRHAAIHCQDGGEYWLVDLGSLNGTYINSRRVFHPVKLADLDRIEVAGEAFIFREKKNPDAGDGVGDFSGPVEYPSATQFFYKSQDHWLLVADIEGFTPLSQSVPPNELAVMVGGWFLACQTIIEANGGRIAKYLGDGFLASWHDRDGTAFQIAEAMRQLSERVQNKPPFRFVIHLGSITTGVCRMPGDDGMLGPSLNFAFRMEKLAGQLRQPVLLSEEANTALSTHISTTRMGVNSLKGFDGDFAFYVPS